VKRKKEKNNRKESVAKLKQLALLAKKNFLSDDKGMQAIFCIVIQMRKTAEKFYIHIMMLCMFFSSLGNLR